MDAVSRALILAEHPRCRCGRHVRLEASERTRFAYIVCDGASVLATARGEVHCRHLVRRDAADQLSDCPLARAS